MFLGKKKILVFLIAMLTSLAAYGDCAGEYCSQVYVQSIYVNAGPDIWVQTPGTEANLTGCAPDSGIFLWLDGNASQKKEILALLMMAQAMDKQVTIRVINGARGCTIAYATLDRQ